MEAKRYEQKVRMFFNEPGFLKHYLERSGSQMSRAEKLKTIFPPTAQLERFRHLEHARLSAQRDLELDGWVTNLIHDFEDKATECARGDKQLQRKKQTCLGKLKMDYVEQQMSEHLDELERLIYDYERYGSLVGAERGYVEKMIVMTEIKKALAVQNGILKKENEMLKNQEEQLDHIINAKKKK